MHVAGSQLPAHLWVVAICLPLIFTTYLIRYCQSYSNPHYNTNRDTKSKRFTMAYCERCDLDFVNEAEQLQHKKANSGVHNLCTPCLVGEPTPEGLTHHFKPSEVHKYTYCSLCNVNFDDEDERNEHLRRLPGDHCFCRPCNFLCNNTSLLQDHFQSSRYHDNIPLLQV